MSHADWAARDNPYASPQTDATSDLAESDAMIRLSHPVRFQDWGRAYRVILIGRKLGVIRNGQTKEFAVPSGACEPSNV